MRESETKPNGKKQLVEGEDFYFENGLMVLTAKYLRDRNHCCGKGCRHCPYPQQASKISK